MIDLIWANFGLLFIWNTVLTILIVLLNNCQKNQEEILYMLRNEVNTALNYIPIHHFEQEENENDN